MIKSNCTKSKLGPQGKQHSFTNIGSDEGKNALIFNEETVVAVRYLLNSLFIYIKRHNLYYYYGNKFKSNEININI